MPSQLRPNQTPEVIRKLRESALREADKPEPNTKQVKTLEFDARHSSRPRDIDPDYPKDVPQIHTTFSEHVGNGSGGVI